MGERIDKEWEKDDHALILQLLAKPQLARTVAEVLRITRSAQTYDKGPEEGSFEEEANQVECFALGHVWERPCRK